MGNELVLVFSNFELDWQIWQRVPLLDAFAKLCLQLTHGSDVAWHGNFADQPEHLVHSSVHAPLQSGCFSQVPVHGGAIVWLSFWRQRAESFQLVQHFSVSGQVFIVFVARLRWGTSCKISPQRSMASRHWAVEALADGCVGNASGASASGTAALARGTTGGGGGGGGGGGCDCASRLALASHAGTSL